MENRELARLLNETADLMEISSDDGFRIRSYRNAAATLETHPERIADIVNDPERKLVGIPGIGKGIAAALTELVERGSFERRDQLLATYPAGILDLLKIQGLGPKSIALIWQNYRVASIEGLEQLCREEKLRELPRMGAKLEEKVLRGIAAYRKRAGRYLLSFGDRAAAELCAYLMETPGVEKLTPAGSLRRGKETIGDLDLLATGPDATAALERFIRHPNATETLATGENKASIRYGSEGLQVDLRALPVESYGAAMQYFTGSKEHNVVLRTRALKAGLTLNEYGLTRIEGNVRIAGATEEEIYRALALDWIPPELRENGGEIEAAAEGRLPHLIEQSDIRGDVHMHTTETDGRASIEEMAAAAEAVGYEYIAITDHSKSLAMTNGLDERRTTELAARVRTWNREHGGIRILSGIECDILRDGTLDLPDSVLAELDFVIGSVHSYLNLEHAEMTARMMRALECPHLRAIGHPTGRILLHRDPYPFDFDRIAAEAARRNVWLEINAGPERLDLSGPMVRAAKAKGARFIVASDAHDPKHFLNMKFGVKTARRGWLTAADVMNTLPYAEFLHAAKGASR